MKKKIVDKRLSPSQMPLISPNMPQIPYSLDEHIFNNGAVKYKKQNNPRDF